MPDNRNEFHIAPMQCYTNAPLRKLCHILSPSSVQWTEMEKVDDLYPRKEQYPDDYLVSALEKRLGSSDIYDEESRLVLQLGSNDPERIEACVENTLKHYNFREINVNCGCPSIESGGAATYGASLMKDASLTGQLVSSIEKALSGSKCLDFRDAPKISVKCRIAVFDHLDNMRPLHDGDYGFLMNYIRTIRDAGAQHVVLHARPAILSGLSPVKNRKNDVVTLNYSFVERIASEFPDLKVTLNGGIKSFSQLKTLQKRSSSTKISSFMAGRWILRRPLDLMGIEQMMKDQNEYFPIEEGFRQETYRNCAKKAIEEYTNYALEMARLIKDRKSFTIAELCLPLYLIAEQLRDDYNCESGDENAAIDDGGDAIEAKVDEDDEKPLLKYESVESIYDTMQNSVKQIEACAKGSGGKNSKKKSRARINESSSPNFRRLTSSFKSIVGTKVANKWKRNRSEL